MALALGLCVVVGLSAAIALQDRGPVQLAVTNQLEATPTADTPIVGSSLADKYEACVSDAGFGPTDAQVLLDASGLPWHVKTSPEVPARFHGPCFEAIGGGETAGSSWALAAPCPTGAILQHCAPEVEAQPHTELTPIDREWKNATSVIGGEAQPPTFWTGESVVILRTTNRGRDVTGEQWDPVTNTATRIADSDLTWRALTASVWTGAEVLVVGGSSGPALNEIAKAYNPTTDTWRTLADPPGQIDGWENSIVGPAAWTGTEMIMWQSSLAYNPTTDSWRELAVGPLTRWARRATVWTGSELIIWGGCHVPNAQCDQINSGLLADGAIYDPAEDVWTEMPPSPLNGAVHLVAGWTGTEAIFIVTDPGEDTDKAAAAFNPSTRTWRDVAPLPLSTRRSSAGVWTGTHFIVWSGGDGKSDRGINDGAAYDPGRDTWTSLPESPGPGRSLHTMVSTDDSIYISATRTVTEPLVLTKMTAE